MKFPVVSSGSAGSAALGDCARVAHPPASALAQRFEPDDAESWHRLGEALAQFGDRAGALTALRNALALDGVRVDTQLALGKLLFDCGQLDSALVYFARATSSRVP
jgi:tetratricopeptide (TPR) repeat protein